MQAQKRKNDFVTVIGAGLAGVEAAWQLAIRNVPVRLYEMRPKINTPAHKTELFAELVCSNSLRAANVENAVGLLKKELAMMDSLVMEAAYATQIPAGGALAVDREAFSRYITKTLLRHELVDFVNEEATGLADFTGPVIVATGPLTSPKMAACIMRLTGQEHLYFYDAAAPLLSRDSLDDGKIFMASRYDKGGGDYINCPLNREEYLAFREQLIGAQVAEREEFEKEVYFEGCMPIEEMARRGEDTMRFGPLKPVGLVDPRTGEEPYAVVQLRQDDAAASVYNIVGFQTHLKWPEQKRVFGMIPGLEKAQFLRYGVMHRNTFINSPQLLNSDFSFNKNASLFFAGQVTGVEGYVESAASGLAAGLSAAKIFAGQKSQGFPRETAIGSLCFYVSSPEVKNFQPMNINFGIMPPLPYKVKGKKNKNIKIAERALESLQEFKQNLSR